MLTNEHIYGGDNIYARLLTSHTYLLLGIDACGIHGLLLSMHMLGYGQCQLLGSFLLA